MEWPTFHLTTKNTMIETITIKMTPTITDAMETMITAMKTETADDRVKNLPTDHVDEVETGPDRKIRATQKE